MRYITLALTLTLLTVCLSCKKPLTPGEGYLDVKGGKIWYSVAGGGDRTPLVLLHGGPGATSSYLKPLLPLAEDRPVIRFDQLGCGNSDRISDTTLMTEDNYVEQMHALLEKLGVKEYYLYGHSWGTMLGMDYYVKYPTGIKKLILASPCISAKRWVADADTLLTSLDDSTELVLRNSMKGVSQDPVAFKKAMDKYGSEFYNRKPIPVLPPSKETESGSAEYQYMWGPSEFYATGTLKNFDRTKELSTVKVPTLFITGDHDAARPTTVRYYQSLTPGAKLVIIHNAGHDTMNDNPAEDLAAIRSFLAE